MCIYRLYIEQTVNEFKDENFKGICFNGEIIRKFKFANEIAVITENGSH